MTANYFVTTKNVSQLLANVPLVTLRTTMFQSYLLFVFLQCNSSPLPIFPKPLVESTRHMKVLCKLFLLEYSVPQSGLVQVPE
jgi:hypothetical protein